MTWQATFTCVVFLITLILLIWQKVPMVILGAAIPAVLATAGIIDPKEAYSDFGNTTVVFFICVS